MRDDEYYEDQAQRSLKRVERAVSPEMADHWRHVAARFMRLAERARQEQQKLSETA